MPVVSTLHDAHSCSIMDFIMINDGSATYIPDENGSLGLHLAAEFGHVNILDQLLRVHSSDSYIGLR